MDYVEGFVAAVPTKNKKKYLEHVQIAAQCAKEYGAKRMVECWGDDIPQGKTTSFYKAVDCKEDETVVFSWIVWPSRKVRDKGMKQLMQDKRVNCVDTPLPFDGTRLIYGGFSVLIDE